MNQLMNQNNNGLQPKEIAVEIMVNAGNLTNFRYTITVDKNISFDIFAQAVFEKVFAAQLKDFFDDKIIFRHKDEMITPTEKKSLDQLKILNNSILQINLALKGGWLHIKL